MKVVQIATAEDAERVVEAATRAAVRALEKIGSLPSAKAALGVLWEMKVTQLGCNPLNAEQPLNLIEQLNQTFTYIASARASQLLLQFHPHAAPFQLNLGTTPGPDIWSDRDGAVAAEVFAATSPKSNDKLRKDVAKVLGYPAQHKYVFFLCPGIAEGQVRDVKFPREIRVWALQATF